MIRCDMNTLIKAIVLSVSASMAASAFAVPEKNHSHHVDPKAQVHKKVVRPSHDWKVGQVIHSQYRKGYSVDYRKYSKLHKPAKNQQWIKVNNDYVLINTLNYKILKMIEG